MRTTNFDALAAAAPLDAQASIVRDGSGDQWEARIDGNHAKHFKAPPRPEMRMPLNTFNLTGAVFDRLKVIRFHTKTGSGRHMWLVRCTCGDYEVRRADSLRKSAGKPAMCFACEQVENLRTKTAKPVTSKDREASAKALDRMAKGNA